MREGKEMKKMMMALALMLSLARLAAAYEIEGNPDRKISFGLNYDRAWSSSEWTFKPFKISDFTKTTQNQFLVDVKIPVSSVFTFQMRGGYLNADNDVFTGERIKSDGYDFGVGVQFYLP